MKRFILLVTIAFVSIVACSPKEETPVIKIERVTIEQNDMTLTVGESATLTATVFPEDAKDKKVSWSSSDEEVVMISSNGKAKAMAVGEAIITAEAGEKTDFITITVVPKVIPVTGISLNPASFTIKVGESQELQVDITPEDATDKSVTWESSNSAVASVENGTVLGVKPGSATITATTTDGGKKAECAVTIKTNLAPSVTVGAEHISAVSVVLSGEANLETSMSADMTMGIMWSTNSGVLPFNSTKIVATEISAKPGFDASFSYSVNLKGLDPATTYYYRSYITQNGQDTYGETMEFSTKTLSSMIHTTDASSLSAVSGKLNSNLDLTDVQYATKSFGFYWGTEPSALSNKAVAAEGEGAISASLSVLSPSTQYYFQAFAVLDERELKEDVQSFTTEDLSSLLETKDATDIEATSAILNAKLDLTDVLYESLEYGFHWGATEESLELDLKGHTLSDKAFLASLSNLSQTTQYWYKSYVKLDDQILYGGVKTFTTDIVHLLNVSFESECYFFTIDDAGAFIPVTVDPVSAKLSELAQVACSPNDVIDFTLTDAGINITPKKIGSTTLTIQSIANEDIKASCTVAITAVPAAPKSVAVVKTGSHFIDGNLVLGNGESFQLQASVTDVDNAVTNAYKVNWRLMTGSSYIDLSADGKVTAKATGLATVRVEVENYPAISTTLMVKVLQAPTDISFTFTGDYAPNANGEVVLKRGKSTSFMINVQPADAISVVNVSVANSLLINEHHSGHDILISHNFQSSIFNFQSSISNPAPSMAALGSVEGAIRVAATFSG